MKYCLIIYSLLFLQLDSFAIKDSTASYFEQTDGRKRKKDGSYRKKNHTLKKLIQGKRYCDCPKH